MAPVAFFCVLFFVCFLCVRSKVAQMNWHPNPQANQTLHLTIEDSILFSWRSDDAFIEAIEEEEILNCTPFDSSTGPSPKHQTFQYDLVDAPAPGKLYFVSHMCGVLTVHITLPVIPPCSVKPISAPGSGFTQTIAGSGPIHVGEKAECFHEDKPHEGRQPGNTALFNYPWGCEFDTARRVLYVADTGCSEEKLANDRLKRIHPNGDVEVLVGGPQGYRDLVGLEARFRQISAIDVNFHDQVVYVADSGNQCIRMVNLTTLEVSTIAGQGSDNREKPGSYVDGPCDVARFHHPQGLAYHSKEHALYVGDTDNHRIRRIDLRTQMVSTVAGGHLFSFADGVGTNARFKHPTELELDEERNVLYVSDHYNHRIRYIELATGTVKTLAGSHEGNCDGRGNAAMFSYPEGISLDHKKKILYLADFGNHRIRAITAVGHRAGPGLTGTLVGADEKGFADGDASTARFHHPSCVSLDLEKGLLYVNDQYNHRIRSVQVSTQNTLTATPKDDEEL